MAMRIFFRLLRYVKKYWRHLTVSVVCTVFYSLFSGASIYLSIPLLETLFSSSGTSVVESVHEATSPADQTWLKKTFEDISKSVQSAIISEDKSESLLRICIIILLAFLFKNLFGYFQAYALAHVEQGIIKDLRDDIYRNLHQLSLGYFTNERTGNLISRVMNDVGVLQGSVAASFLNLIREPLLIAVFLAIAISISWKLTLLSFIVLPISLFIISRIGMRLRKVGGLVQRKLADITSVLQETISGVKVVKAFGMEEFENRKFARETREFFRQMLRISRIRNLASPVTEFLSVAAGVIIIWYGGSQVLEGQAIKPAEMIGFLLAIFQTMPPIKELSGVANRIQESSAAGERVFEIIDKQPSVRNAPDAISIGEFLEKIEFRNVSFSYEQDPGLRDTNGRAILKKVSFTVRKGEVLAIVGPSGGGKTTLVDLIPRFYDPIEGSILFDGVDIKKIEIKSLREKIGIVTQETILFNDTVRNNIAYGLDDCPLEKVREAAKAANAHDFIEEMPHAYETIIGERGVKLSGGQRQRLSIARALLKNPPVMIFDEATSSLDSESELLVQEAIERLMRNRTTFVIAHRLSTIRNADRIIVIDNGEIAQQGTHSELINERDRLYRKLYDMQFNL